MRGGDLGALPAVAGIVVLAILFTALRPDTFPTPLNITNLLVQAVPIILLAMGLVFVLLLGEIDLSAGVVSGVCAAVMAVMMARHDVAWYWAVLAAIVVGALIGLFTGVLVSVVRIPSFVVTLALFLGWQGVTLRIIGQGGTVPVRDPVIVGFTNSSMSVLWGWILAVVVILLFAALQLNRWRVQRSRNLASQPLAVVVARIVVIALVTIAGHVGAEREPGAEPQHPAGRGSLRHPDRRGAPADPHLRAHADPLRPARVRGRRERGGVASRRHQRRPDPHPGVRAVVGDGCDQRHRGGVPPRVGGRRAPAAATRCSTPSRPRSSAAPASSAVAVASGTPSSVVWSSRSSPTGWGCSASRRT